MWGSSVPVTRETQTILSSKLVVAEYEGSRYSVGLRPPTEENLSKKVGRRVGEEREEREEREE